MSISNHREQLILEALRAGDLFVKLHVGDPGEDCTQNPATNADRLEASFAAAVAGTMATDTVLEWPEVPADEEYTHVSLWDADVAGNAEWSGPLTEPVDIKAGNDFRLKAGKLKVSVN
jgi:hypothetical protein